MGGKGRWRSSGSAKGGLAGERKALVERYMIDAEEAQSRARLAAEEQLRREAAEEQQRREAGQRQRRAAEEEAARETAATAERQARKRIAQEAERDARERAAAAAATHRPEEEPAASEEDADAEEDLPIYTWVRSNEEARRASATPDWPRALVRSRVLAERKDD